MKKPRLLFAFIIFITIAAIFIDLPSSFTLKLGSFSQKISVPQEAVLQRLNISRALEFRQGLDLEGGTSITLKADMTGVSVDQRQDALDSARTVIERRVNLFGVAEPIIQTSAASGDYRIIVELPGITDLNQVKELIGTTAQLTFWEPGATGSADLKQATQSAYPLGLVETLGSNPKKTDLSGNDLKQATVGFDQNTGNPEVLLTFTSEGTRKFAEITSRNVGKRVAIVLDDMVIEAPTVNEAIPGGNARISGGFTIEMAKTLVTELNAGALPVPLETLQSHVVGPTLGRQSLDKSLFAGILGFLTIVIFMVVLYRMRGLVASLALICYSLFVLAIFKLSSLTPYGITITLSGIAGFILSVGMAVDANILIFERMKEEERAGRDVSSAMNIGFSRAWPSIRDSNIATLITSAILYRFGTGMVKGFALVLAIGVLVSMFSAITVTRIFLRLFYRK